MSAVEELRDQLWQAILTKVAEIAPRGSRSQAYYSVDGKACLAIAENWESDGTSTVYRIEASAYYGLVDVRVETSTSVHENHWRPVMDATDRNERVVVDDQCYAIRPDSPQPGCGDGYGGRKFVIEWLNEFGEPTGETTTTRNLWHRGTIPPVFRDRLAPNARFAEVL